MMTAQKISEFVDDRILRCDERFGNKQGMIDLLVKRINEAADNGLASAVYWFKWMNYSESVQVLKVLKARIEAQDEESQVCPHCQGTGRDSHDERRPCDHCDGEGVLCDAN